jgi:hypothetical protein
MFVPEQMPKCIAYLGYELANGEKRLAGSAFFVGRIVAEDLPDILFGYLVTARHVIEAIRAKGLLKILLRVNLKSGIASWIETDIQNWAFHPNPANDVAVLRRSIAPEFDHRMWPATGFALPATILAERISVGDEIFFTGLFSRAYGETKNIPIVRIGNIAAMPDEPIKTKLGYADAYLVEARSIGGLSGSPVFINTGGSPRMKGQLTGGLATFFLLGLVHGHFDIEDEEIDNVADDGLERIFVNTGIAIVTPAEKILETIRMFAEIEKPMVDDLRNKNLPSMD